MLSLATFQFLAAGSLLGLSAGIAPGPLLSLVLVETLRHGRTAGLKVAAAPLITDLPIILLSLFVLQKLAHVHAVLGVIAAAGGLYLAFLGWEALRTRGLPPPVASAQTKSLHKGIVANVLNPHPWLFWTTVGAPYLLKAFAHDTHAGVLFVTMFYVFLVGSKAAIVLLAACGTGGMGQRPYVAAMRLLGAALLVFAALLLSEGYTSFFART